MVTNRGADNCTGHRVRTTGNPPTDPLVRVLVVAGAATQSPLRAPARNLPTGYLQRDHHQSDPRRPLNAKPHTQRLPSSHLYLVA